MDAHYRYVEPTNRDKQYRSEMVLRVKEGRGGLRALTLLIEGTIQALENDVVLSMKAFREVAAK